VAPNRQKWRSRTQLPGANATKGHYAFCELNPVGYSPNDSLRRRGGMVGEKLKVELGRMMKRAILAGFLMMSACGEEASKTEDAAAPAPTASPPQLADLNGCLVPAEVAAGERFLGERKPVVSPSGSYELKMKGDVSNADYVVTCEGSGSTSTLVLMESTATGGVRKADLAVVAPKLANAGRINLGEDTGIASALWVRGDIGADGSVDKFFIAIPFEAPNNASYCVSAVAKFAAQSGKGSTSIAIDTDEWKNWGHTIEDGKTFDAPFSFPLSAGPHVIYLKKREDTLSRLKVEMCPT
jgi:hypothetical protein